MSESGQHQKLVEKLIEEITQSVGIENSCFIESDAVDNRPLPQLTQEGFRPDVYYQFKDTLIIGEAKTSADVERPHSIAQYESYMKQCSCFYGNATFIIAVPWQEYASIYNITQKLKKKYPGTYVVRIIKGIGV